MLYNHLIGKQIFKLEYHSKEFPYALQQQISEMYWNRLAPELDTLFSEIVPQNKTLQLNKIEIDLGNLKLEKNFEDELVDRVLIELKDKILKQRQLISTSNSLVKDLDKNQLVDTETHAFHLWLYWLEHGILPSHSVKPTPKWHELLLKELVLNPVSLDILKNTISKSENALQRLIVQHEVTFLISLLEIYTGHSQKTVRELLLLLNQKTDKFKEKTRLSYLKLECDFWRETISKVILNDHKLRSEEITNLLVKNTLNLEHGSFNPEEISEYHIKGYPSFKLKTRDTDSNLDTTEIKEENDNHAHFSSEEIEDNEKLESEIDSEFIQYVENAGLILLHPFLPHFFQKLKLTENKSFKNKQSHAKAVIILHYLAYGKSYESELDLVFPKILCNWPLGFPIDKHYKLLKKEKKEANNLLNVVIERWDALGKSSVEGLREGFIIRDGKFTKSENGLKLILESKTIDILLNRLPWNLSIVKLPWMKDMITIEWH